MEEDRKTSEHQSSLPGFLGVIDSLISRCESFALAAGVLLMAVNTIANVVGRYIFQHSIFFTEEVKSMISGLITFAGISNSALLCRQILISAIFYFSPFGWPKLMWFFLAAVT